MKEKHQLEDEVDKAKEKEKDNESEEKKLEDELYNMTVDRNKLRKIKITLAIENVSLKESLAVMKTKVEVLEAECEQLREWKTKAGMLEEECEDLRYWKPKAEALEEDCAELREVRTKLETLETECAELRELKTKAKTLETECEGLRELKTKAETLETECKELRAWKDKNHDLEGQCCQLFTQKTNLEEECGNLREYKEKAERLETECETLHEYKKKAEALEIECQGLYEHKTKAEELEAECESLRQLKYKSDQIEKQYETFQDYRANIEKLEEENKKLCQSHQVALEKQWDVLEADLKTFEAKVEELENECESVRRDHLSSMVENSELVRERDRLQTAVKENKCSLEILETAYECLQKEQERREVLRMKEQNDYYASIESLKRNVVDLESTFTERLRQQAANYAVCLAPRNKVNGFEPACLTRQEHEILLAEKSVLLQERDSAHRKLCSVEVQNLHLNANMECLRQELARAMHERKNSDLNGEVLLAQDVVNLRSIVSSLEEEVLEADQGKNRMLGVEASLRQEISELQQDLLVVKTEKAKLGAALEESERRSSLEHIHSAASSLKEQLAKAIKDREVTITSLKEEVAKVGKEKEQLANVANERDELIFSLSGQVRKLTTEGDDLISSLKEQLAKAAEERDDMVSDIKRQLAKAIKERDELLEEKFNLTHDCEHLETKLSLLNNERVSLADKIEVSQRERCKLQGECKKVEVEFRSTREKLEAEVRLTREQLALAIKETERLAADNMSRIELAKNLSEDLAMAVQDSEILFEEKSMWIEQESKLVEELQSLKERLEIAFESQEKEHSNVPSAEKTDALLATMQSLNEKLISVVKDKEQAELEREKLRQECEGFRFAISKLEREEEGMSERFKRNRSLLETESEVAKERAKHDELVKNVQTLTEKLDVAVIQNRSLASENESLEQTMNDVQAAHSLLVKEKEVLTKKLVKHNHEMELATSKTELAMAAKSLEKMAASELCLKHQLREPRTTIQLLRKELDSNEFPPRKHELNVEVAPTNNELAIAACEETSTGCEVLSLNRKNDEFGATVQSLNEQLSNLSGEKHQLTLSKQSLMHERDHLLAAVNKLETEKEAMSKRFEQDLHVEVSSVKSLLATAAKEKEEMAMSEGSLQQKLDDLYTTVQSLNDQLATLSNEKDRLVQANKVVMQDRDKLLAEKEAIKQKLTTEIGSIKKEMAALSTNSSAQLEQHAKITKTLTQELDKSISEATLLMEQTAQKSGEDLNEIVSLKTELATALKKNERLAASEESSKQKVHDLAESQDEQQANLHMGNGLLVEGRDAGPVMIKVPFNMCPDYDDKMIKILNKIGAS